MPKYAVGPILFDGDVKALASWLEVELQKIAETLAQVVENPIQERHVAPTKPVNGLIVLADGTDWDPGSGRGMYWYDGDAATWTFLG